MGLSVDSEKASEKVEYLLFRLKTLKGVRTSLTTGAQQGTRTRVAEEEGRLERELMAEGWSKARLTELEESWS
jgi:hypothetical protein